MELFAKIVDCIQPSTIFAKQLILFFSLGFDHVPIKKLNKTGVLSFNSQKIRTAISANLFLNSILLHIIALP